MSVIVNFNMGPHSPFRTISRLRRTHEQEAADAITRFSGTITFGLLTLIVSLEAIFLSTFVLMSQNESGRRDAKREANDHYTDLWSEAWAEMIGEKLGIDAADVRKRYEQRLREEQKNDAA